MPLFMLQGPNPSASMIGQIRRRCSVRHVFLSAPFFLTRARTGPAGRNGRSSGTPDSPGLVSWLGSKRVLQFAQLGHEKRGLEVLRAILAKRQFVG